MKVYLDDTRTPPAGWTGAKDIASAKRYLTSGVVTHLSLDHDLADPAQSGQALLDWMHDTNRWPKYVPKVHSGNVAAAQGMKAFIAAHTGHLAAAPPTVRLQPRGQARYTAAASQWATATTPASSSTPTPK